METIKTFVKDYFVFLLLLQMVSYLTPKENYKKYMQFFTGALMAIVLLKPVLSWMDSSYDVHSYKPFDEMMEQLEQIEFVGEEANMFDIFFGEETME